MEALEKLNRMKRLLYILIVFILAQACEKQEYTATVAEGAEVEVNLNLSAVAGLDVSVSEDMVQTKAVHDPSTINKATDVIKNLWIIQYRGVEDNSVLIGEPTYISDFSTFDGKIKLVSITGPTSIFFIANTFENKNAFPIAQGSTIADLKARSRELTDEYTIFGNDLQNYHPIFFAREDIAEITEGMDIAVSLSRNIAKVNIQITNNTPANNRVTLLNAQLCSVPKVSFYIPDETQGTFPATRSFTTFNYEKKTWPNGENTLRFTTYMPVNKRGTTGSVTPAYKNIGHPEDATYLILNGTYKEGENVTPISYTFYLGENLTNNFNILSNKNYTFNISINTVGDSETDSRIEDWGTVDFTSNRYPNANSYILNPMPEGYGMRTFRIPINRIMEFWGEDIGKNEYENDITMSLRNNEGKWRAFILTSDFQITSENFILHKNNGTKNTSPYFEVKVAPGVKGNVIIGVGPDDNSSPKNISWSWHLWITDYNPYEALEWNSNISGVYIYPVTGGDVHRYEGTFWKTNSRIYIMDRNLGSVTAKYPEDNKGLLYYQYGRKDPFLFSNSFYLYPENTGHTRRSETYGNANQSNGVLYAIRNPLTFIKGEQIPGGNSNDHTNWAVGSKYSPNEDNPNIIWNDHTTDKEASREGRKSIFDPCPPGYRLPHKDTWSDFTWHNESKRTTNAFKSSHFPDKTELIDSYYKNNFKPYNKIKGLQYWPYQGEDILIPDNAIYIPASGYLVPTSGEISAHGNLPSDNKTNGLYEKWSFLWAEVSPTVHNGYGYTSQQDHLAAMNTVSKSRAFPVRCITDNRN